MQIIVGILAFVVAALAVLQGWQMRRNRRNPNIAARLDGIADQLGEIRNGLGGIATQTGRMEQRLNDIWDRVKV